MRAQRALYKWGLFLCCSGLFLFAARADAQITRFVFITEPQTVAAQELSGAYTIQAQDAAREARQSEETIDLTFSSTSATGEFLSATGEPVRTVMNKGTANRTFYYRDATAGTHTLTVVAVGRVSGQTWTASQKIAVGSVASAPAPAALAPALDAPAPSSGSVSALPPAPAIEARAGPDRTAIAGTSVDFKGMAIGLLGAPIDNARFWWNFGDGAVTEGKDASHIFRAPGTYTAGLHVSSGVYAASDYATIAVIPNKVIIKEVIAGEGGFIRIRNESDATVDIGGWAIAAADGRKFMLPPYTMVRGKSDIALAHTVTGLSGAVPLRVHFPDGSLAFVYADEPAAPARDSAPSVPIIAAAVPPVPVAQIETADTKSDQATATASLHDEAPLPHPYAASAGMGAFAFSYSFFALAVFLSAGASAGFLLLKKFFA